MSTDALAPVLALLIILILVARTKVEQYWIAPGAAGSSRAVPELRVHLTAEHDRTRELAAAALQLRNFSARTRQGADQPGAVDVESVREDQQCQQRREQLAALDSVRSRCDADGRPVRARPPSMPAAWRVARM